MSIYIFIIIMSLTGLIIFGILGISEDKLVNKQTNFIEAIENAFNTGKTVVGINTINSTSVSMSKDNGFSLVNDINGRKIIAGNGHSFLLSNCTIH